MNDIPKTFRYERIEKLLYELEYEIKRGIMENEIDESLTFEFSIPISRSIPNGAVLGSFRVRPVPSYMYTQEPKLRIVK